MKKLIFSLMITALLAVVWACTGTTEVNYRVTGVVPDSLNGKNVYLYSYEVEKSQIASTVVSDGRFEFTGTRQKPVVAIVVIGDADRKDYGCVLDEVPVVMNYDGNRFEVTGSRRTEALLEYYALEEEQARNTRKTDIPHPMQLMLRGQKREYTDAELNELKEVEEHNKKVYATYFAKRDELMKRNTDNVVGAYLFSRIYTGNGVNESVEAQDSILAVAGKEFLETPMVERIMTAHNQRVGKAFTDFELPDKEGKKHRLSDIVGEGRYVLVDIWASWCIGCRIETPHVKEAYAKWHDRGFEVVMVSVDSEDDNKSWLKAMEKDGVTDMGYQLVDKSSITRKLYGAATIPCNMLIGPDGKIVANNLRGNDLEKKLSKLIGE